MGIVEDMINKYGVDKINQRAPSPHDNNMIHFCYKCGDSIFYNVIIDEFEHGVCEKEIRCKKCDSLVNYWSYGYYDNDISPEYEQMLRRKKLERLC